MLATTMHGISQLLGLLDLGHACDSMGCRVRRAAVLAAKSP